MLVGVGAGVGVGVGVDFSKPESESESESLKSGRLRSPARIPVDSDTTRILDLGSEWISCLIAKTDL